MADQPDLRRLVPAAVFDGGDLDCGSGLVLLIREHMQTVAAGEILEMRSREPTVGDDLPPWCRMVGHEYLGRLDGDGPGSARYFIRRGAAAPAEDAALARDKARARDYEWRARVRVTGPQASSVYCRNFSFAAGQAASFEERDAHPSAVEYLLGALGADLAAGFANACAQAGLTADDIELTVRGRLHDVLAHLGLAEGDPALARIEVKCFLSTPDDEAAAQAAWLSAQARSPLLATLRKAVAVDLRLSLV
ncbi:osmotically inducible protein OsmC [bacterium]|nr:osmotically inducible protein OsmC [bacterium]